MLSKVIAAGMLVTRETLHTAAELADRVARIDQLEGVARHEAMWDFEFELDVSPLKELDPFSEAFIERVSSLYHVIHPGHYDIGHESQVLDFDPKYPTPFPSQSPPLIGGHFGAIATILRDFPVMPPGRVLDVGVGWGHTSLLLARSGFDVDALDTNEQYLKLVDLWAERTFVEDRLRTLHLSFSEIGCLDQVYDAILFFESFHHALRHREVLRDCLAVLKPGGCLVFAGEPIFADWPVPWGVRSDNLAAYCINKFGWMELGFHQDYFLELLYREGLWCASRGYAEFPIANGYVARRCEGHIPMQSICLPSVIEKTWHPSEQGLRWTTGESILPGTLVGAGLSALMVKNLSPEAMLVELIVGDHVVSHKMIPAEAEIQVPFMHTSLAEDIVVRSPTWSPLKHGSMDPRILGIAVTALVFNNQS